MRKAKLDKQPVSGCLSFLKENILLVLGIVIAISFCMYGITGVYGFSAFPDEFGYWAPAAALLGYDWSEITSLGSYYSYGYSVFLIGILALFKGSISAYRAAVIVNLLMHCASILILYNILIRIAQTEKNNTRAIIAIISALYPAWVFYTQTTMAESLLYFLLVLTSLLMIRFLEKPGIVRGLVFVVVLVYCYFVHMRCIGLIGAGVLTILLWLISQRKKGFGKKVWLIPILILVLFAASFIIKGIVTGSVYRGVSKDVLNWNDYASIPYRVMKTFGDGGLKYLLLDVTGKLYYLGMSSFGIAYFGLFSLICHFAKGIKKIFRREAVGLDFFWVFLFLTVIAQFLVALVYLNGASAPDNERIDVFLHGRYFDFCVPILIAVGLDYMISCSQLLAGAGIVAAIYGVLFYFVRGVVINNQTGMNSYRGLIMIGMSYFLGSDFEDAYSYLIKETVLRAILSAVVILSFMAFRKLRQESVLLLILLIQVVFSFNACNNFIFPKQENIYGDIAFGEELREMRAQYPDRKLVHVYEGGSQYIEIVQFTDRDAHIEAINAEYGKIDISECFDENTMLILPRYSEYLEKAGEFYDGSMVRGHLCIFYMKE